MQGCGGCGADNRDGARFCDSCGRSLAAADPTPAAQARKVVTVLFADLVGSTAAQEAMDPESVRRWIDRYYAAVRAEVEGQGGRVVKFIGDGMMAVFGVPDVREDDADRAVAAAVGMHTAVAGLTGGPAGVSVGLRVGVNTGEVVVSAGDDDVVGDAVNVAARLEQAARPGQVLVGEATFRLVRSRTELRAIPPLDLKGKAEPVPAFLLVSLGRAEDDGAGSPFVGRAGELERLTAVLEGAIGDRRPQLASIVGAPGVGKSRLVQELGAAAAVRSAGVVVVRCDPAGGATFAPVATALRAAAGLEDDADADTVLAGLTAFLDEDEPERDRVARGTAALLGVGELGLPEETFWAVRRLIESAARRRPLVFVFEDVHWAEPLLVDLIENLAAFARDVPVLLVVTARPELREQRPSLVEVGGRVTAAVHLEGLAVDESRRLTRALLDGAALPAALLDRVATASEGNPLFVRELVRMLVDDGILRREDGAWTAAVDARSIDVPLSIHAVLAARIDRLPAAEQEVLSAASIMGRTFARGAVAHLVAPAVAEHLHDHLEGLRRKELIERAGTYWLDEPQLRFHHALVQDAAYRRLLKEVRAPLHAEAAAWLEVVVGDSTEHDDLIGFQLEQAHLLLVEAGTGDDDIGRSAAVRLRGAGRRALEADDRSGAAGLLGRALGCLPDGDPSRPDLLLDQCEALLSLGDVTAAAPMVAELAGVAVGDARLEGWVACFEGELANLRDPGHLADTAARAEAAAATLADIGDHAGTAKAHAVRAASLARLGRIADCERALDQALGAARSAGDRRRATSILAGAPTAALWGPNPVTRASGRCLDVVRVLRITSRAPAVEAISLRCQAVLEAMRGRDGAARRMLASARSSLEELGHAHGLVEVDLAAGMVETLADDLDAASVHLERALEGFHELGIDVDAGLAAALLARVRRRQGATEEAIALTHESERLGGDDLRTGIAWRSVRAAALASQGELVEAGRLAAEAVALAEATDALVDHGDALLAHADVLARAGDAVGSRRSARLALELYERKEAGVLAARAHETLGSRPAARSARSGTEGAVAPADGSLPGASRVTPATTGALRVTAAMSPYDEVALHVALAADVEMYDLRPLVGSPDPLDVTASLASVATLGVRAVHTRAIAVRGDHHLLVEVAYPIPVEEGSAEESVLRLLQVQEFTSAAEMRVNLLYDEEQAPEARAELERRYCDRLDAEEAASWWTVVEHAAAESLACVDAVLVTSCGAVVIVEGRGTVGFEVAEGRVARSRSFAGHDVDEAIAWLRALDAATGGPAGVDDRDRDGASGPSDNRATRLYRQMVGGQLGALEDLGALVRDDFSYTDHRALVGAGEDIGFDAAVAWSSGLDDLGFEFVEVEVLAVRGERVGLVRTVRHFDGAVVEVLLVVAIDAEGLGSSLDVYDVSDLAEALALVAQLHDEPAALLGNAVTRSYDRAIRLALEGHPDAFRDVHPDLVSFDHRPILGGGAHIEGSGVAKEWLEGLAQMGFVSAETEVLAIRGERLGLVSSRRHAGDSTMEVLTIVQADEAALACQIDVYDASQLDEALAELEERHAELERSSEPAGDPEA